MVELIISHPQRLLFKVNIPLICTLLGKVPGPSQPHLLQYCVSGRHIPGRITLCVCRACLAVLKPSHLHLFTMGQGCFKLSQDVGIYPTQRWHGPPSCHCKDVTQSSHQSPAFILAELSGYIAVSPRLPVSLLNSVCQTYHQSSDFSVVLDLTGLEDSKNSRWGQGNSQSSMLFSFF